MLALNNALVPQIIGPGLQIQVYQGTVLINGSETSFPTTVVGLAANKTTYVYINISSSTIQTNTTGFVVNNYPIAIVTTANTGVSSLLDMRPDYIIQGANTGINGRFILNYGTNLSSGNFAFSGWGSGAAISAISGKDSAHTFTITAGSAPSVAPTVTLTFADGAWNSAPLVYAQLVKGTGSLLPVTPASNASTYTLTFNGLPVNGQTYTVNVLVCGLS